MKEPLPTTQLNAEEMMACGELPDACLPFFNSAIATTLDDGTKDQCFNCKKSFHNHELFSFGSTEPAYCEPCYRIVGKAIVDAVFKPL